MPENPPLIAGTRIGHVPLKVADLDRALGFYCGVLGFEMMQRMGSGAAFISAGGYHHHIGLNTGKAKAAIRRRRAPPGCFTPRSSIPRGRRWRMRFIA
jgi:catechol-2,3-dioxygenase